MCKCKQERSKKIRKQQICHHYIFQLKFIQICGFLFTFESILGIFLFTFLCYFIYVQLYSQHMCYFLITFFCQKYISQIFLSMNRSSISPYKTTFSRAAGSESTEALIRSLELENSSLVEQIGILRSKVNRTSELEDKIELILRHNTQLLNENERLAKLINQKKSEIDIWKNKHDSVIANKSTASDLEVKRLLNEIEKLKEESCQIEHAKNLQINQIKNQHHLQIQNIKRNSLGSAEKYELEIRKFKELCQKKDYQISDLKMKIARISKQTDFEIAKLREEKERLRNDLQFEEAEHRKQVQSLKSKFDYNFHSEIENLKKQHLNQIETLDYENSKLKQVVNSKNLELEQSIAKQSKMRNHFEDSIELLKKENNELKQKLVENQHISNLELNNLRDKLDGIKQSEVAILTDAHSNQVDILNREILKLNKFLDNRNQEIQNVCRQRNQMRQNFEAELSKVRAELERQKLENTDLIAKQEEALRLCDIDYKEKNQEMKTMESLLKSQIEAVRKEKQTAQSLLKRRQKQLDIERENARNDQSKAESEISALKQLNNQLRDQSERSSRRASQDSEDARRMSELKTKKLQTKIAGLEQENAQKDSLISQLKQNINLLQRQLKLSDDKIQLLQNTQRQLRNQAKQSFTRWDSKQKQQNRLIRDQIERMQRSKHNEIEQLKSIHENKIRSLKHQIKELEKHIDDKNRVINDLKAKYEELVNSFEKVFAQEAARKNLDIKVPGWLPDTLALKALFDVFLKNKVLEYCS